MAKRIVGQERVVEEVLMAMFAGGHALLVGVPGLAKTLMIRSIADAMRLDFRRILFTPDLVPSDITGTEIMEEDTATGARRFRFVRGPIFSNIVLADEINRMPSRARGRGGGGALVRGVRGWIRRKRSHRRSPAPERAAGARAGA